MFESSSDEEFDFDSDDRDWDPVPVVLQGMFPSLQRKMSEVLRQGGPGLFYDCRRYERYNSFG